MTNSLQIKQKALPLQPLIRDISLIQIINH